MSNPYRAMCAELVEQFNAPAGSIPQLAERIRKLGELADRARALLAQPVTEGLTEIALQMLGTIESMGLIIPEITDTIRKALEQGRRPTPQPVAVSERLPGDELCWWFEPDEDDGYGGMWTLLRIRGGTTRYTHWLPANALPTPEAKP